MLISQSQINLFRHCPYAYALKYKYKKEGIWFDPSVIEVGKRVHDAIDKYYKSYYYIYNNSGEILKTVYGILREEWDVTLPAEYLKKAYTCLINFSEFEMNNIDKGITIKPLTEYDIKSRTEGLRGIIDYFDITNKKVIDFKTNSKAGLGYENRMQAVMYKGLIKQKLGIDIPYFTFQFLFPNEVRVVKWDKKTNKVREELYEYVKQIREAWKSKDFPKNPRTNSACKWCQFNYYCGGI